MLKILAPVFWTTTESLTISLGRLVLSSWPKIPRVILTQLGRTHRPRCHYTWPVKVIISVWHEEVSLEMRLEGQLQTSSLFVWSSREFLVYYGLVFFLYSKKKKKGYLDSKSRGLKSSLKSREMTLRKFCSRIFEPTQSAIVSEPHTRTLLCE